MTTGCLERTVTINSGGGDGDDYLNGDRGDDVLIGGGGNDIMAGETGADIYVFAPGHGDDIIYHFFRQPI